jgi:excisionase family DNA binding protein
MTETDETTELSASATPLDRWLGLPAAAKKMGWAKRTLERYIQAGLIVAKRGKPPGSRQTTRMVDPVALTKLKHDLRTGEIQLHWDRTTPKTGAVARRVAQHDATAAQVPASIGVSNDPWLTLEEAATYVRLPAAYLRRRLDAGELDARDVLNGTGHSWRVKRSAIDALEWAEKAEGRYLRGATEGSEAAHRARFPRKRSRNPWVRLGIVSGD